MPDDAAPALGGHRTVGSLPDPTKLCCSVVRSAIEVLRGDRTAAQLTRWVTPAIRDTLTRRASLTLRSNGARHLESDAAIRPVTVMRSRTLRLGEKSAEATVIVHDGERVRAVAARLEEWRGMWRVVALEIG